MIMDTSLPAGIRADDRLANYDCKKATQALNYLLQKNRGHSLHKVALVKLLWAADRYHLRTYGRLVSDEPYIAMEKGPVGSMAKDIIYGVTDYGVSEECLPYISSYIKKDDDTVTSLRNTDTDYLAKTDIEALDFAWQNFGNLNDTELAEVSHQYPEWSRYADPLESKTAKSVPMDLNDFYADPPQLSDDPFEMDESTKQHNKDQFFRSRQATALLRD
jgi:uncharacterized phage-associated protein